MNKRKLAVFRKQLNQLAARLGGDIDALDDQARMPTGSQAVGNLSHAPMHLGDMGTEVDLQELNATLLENEEYLRNEVLGALERIDDGTYGDCENCGVKIVEERLKLLPYARYCTPCAEKLQSGKDINLNSGRPRDPGDTHQSFDVRVSSAMMGADDTGRPVGHEPGLAEGDEADRADIHAAGTAGGGTAEGGLAGTNVGEGDPGNPDLEDAMGSSTHDVAIEADPEDTVPYSGPAGGAVGCTPAGKRAVGGKSRRRGIRPSEDPDRPESG